MPLVRRTRATLRKAEFGFLGVTVATRVQTPRRCGAPPSAGVFVLAFGVDRPFLTSWLTVGTKEALRPLQILRSQNNGRRGARPANRTAECSESPLRASNQAFCENPFVVAGLE